MTQTTDKSAAEQHAMNCAFGSGGFCNCGLAERIRADTAMTLLAAWQKRANEAEAERDLARQELAAAKGLLAAVRDHDRERDAEIMRLRQALASHVPITFHADVVERFNQHLRELKRQAAALTKVANPPAPAVEGPQPAPLKPGDPTHDCTDNCGKVHAQTVRPAEGACAICRLAENDPIHGRARFDGMLRHDYRPAPVRPAETPETHSFLGRAGSLCCHVTYPDGPYPPGQPKECGRYISDPVHAPKPIMEALLELAPLVAPHWEGVDVADEVNAIRGMTAAQPPTEGAPARIVPHDDAPFIAAEFNDFNVEGAPASEDAECVNPYHNNQPHPPMDGCYAIRPPAPAPVEAPACSSCGGVLTIGERAAGLCVHCAPVEAPRGEACSHLWFLADTGYGMTGGDLYLCRRSCGSRVVTRPEATPPKDGPFAAPAPSPETPTAPTCAKCGRFSSHASHRPITGHPTGALVDHAFVPIRPPETPKPAPEAKGDAE